MRRRELLAFIGGAMAPRSVVAQQRKAATVFCLFGGSTALFKAVGLELFRAGLATLGYRDQENAKVEYQTAEGRYDLLPGMAAEIIGRKPDVIATFASPATLAVKAATSTIPIVFAMGADPVALGIVSSLNRPGGNITGATFLSVELQGKQLGMLHDLLPNIKSVGFLIKPDAPDASAQTSRAEAAARSLGLALRVVNARRESDFEPAFATLVEQHVDVLLVAGDEFFTSEVDPIAALSTRYRLPVIGNVRLFPAAGCLASYGGTIGEAVRQAGLYAGRILNGEAPSDLPVVEATKFELVVNVKAAKVLDLTIPPSTLQFADEIIE